MEEVHGKISENLSKYLASRTIIKIANFLERENYFRPFFPFCQTLTGFENSATGIYKLATVENVYSLSLSLQFITRGIDTSYYFLKGLTFPFLCITSGVFSTV